MVSCSYISKLPVTFEGLTLFERNNGTTLDVVSSTVNFEPESHVNFSNNHASANGGALNLIGGSSITVRHNSNFTFTNNTACKGAAIRQHSTDPQDFVFSKSCFLKYDF